MIIVIGAGFLQMLLRWHRTTWTDILTFYCNTIGRSNWRNLRNKSVCTSKQNENQYRRITTLRIVQIQALWPISKYVFGVWNQSCCMWHLNRKHLHRSMFAFFLNLKLTWIWSGSNTCCWWVVCHRPKHVSLFFVVDIVLPNRSVCDCRKRLFAWFTCTYRQRKRKRENNNGFIKMDFRMEKSTEKKIIIVWSEFLLLLHRYQISNQNRSILSTKFF